MKHQNGSLMMLSGEKKNQVHRNFLWQLKDFVYISLVLEASIPHWGDQCESLEKRNLIVFCFFSRKKPQNIQNKNKNGTTRTNDSDC